MNPVTDLLHHRPGGSDHSEPCDERLDERLQVRFFARAVEPRLHSPDFRAGEPGRARGYPDHHGLYRFRLHRALAACRLAGANYAALLATTDRTQANRVDGWRHHARG